VRGEAAPETRKCCAIFRSRGQGNCQSTTVDSPRTRRERGLAISANSPQSRSVRSRSRVNGQSVNRQWQRLWTIHRQAAYAIFPRPQSGCVRELSVLHDWPTNVRAVAVRFRPVVRTRSDPIQNHSNLMSTFNPDNIRKAVEEFTPRRPQKFQELFAAKDVVMELRKKRASYRSIADLLTRHCLPTCKTSVALFCHKVLGEKVRPYRRPALKSPPASETPPRGEESSVTSPLTEASPHADANGVENPPVRARGPRIAQVRMLKPQPQTT
jgi:hypothetical protein